MNILLIFIDINIGESDIIQFNEINFRLDEYLSEQINNILEKIYDDYSHYQDYLYIHITCSKNLHNIRQNGLYSESEKQFTIGDRNNSGGKRYKFIKKYIKSRKINRRKYIKKINKDKKINKGKKINKCNKTI